MELITNTYKKDINGILSCLDRVILTGTLPEICHAQGMSSYLYRKGIRIFDYPKFAEPYREKLRLQAEQLAKTNNVDIEFVSRSGIRKEDLVKKKVLDKRGTHPGLVHILSAME